MRLTRWYFLILLVKCFDLTSSIPSTSVPSVQEKCQLSTTSYCSNRTNSNSSDYGDVCYKELGGVYLPCAYLCRKVDGQYVQDWRCSELCFYIYKNCDSVFYPPKTDTTTMISTVTSNMTSTMTSNVTEGTLIDCEGARIDWIVVALGLGVALSIALLVIVGLVVYIIVCLKKRKATKEQGAAEESLATLMDRSASSSGFGSSDSARATNEHCL